MTMMSGLQHGVTLYIDQHGVYDSEVISPLSSSFVSDLDDQSTEELDDEDKIFILTPVKDEWRQLFDKFDPEGFGEIPLDLFEQALDSRDFVQMISPGKLIILQDRLKQHRQMGLPAITFQDFVNTLSSKRSLSFKCAMHCRDKQVFDPADFQLKRQASIYSIGDLIKETVAKETLTDGRDRKYFVVQQKQGRCCRPPPLLFVSLCLLQIVLFMIFFGDKSDNVLVFHPHRMEEAWRYLTYCLIHTDVIHLLVNLSVQLVIGVPLEMVHGSCRMLLIYASGVLMGSICSSIFDKSAHLAGAGGGAYALLSAHVSNLILHYPSMSRPWLKCLIMLLLASVEVGFGIYRRYATLAENQPPISYVAHLSGVFSGLSLGLVILRNFEQKLSERRAWWLAIGTLSALALAAFLYHYLHKNQAFRLICTQTTQCPS